MNSHVGIPTFHHIQVHTLTLINPCFKYVPLPLPAFQCSRGHKCLLATAFSGFPLPSYTENNALKGRQAEISARPVSSQISCPQGTGKMGPLNGQELTVWLISVSPGCALPKSYTSFSSSHELYYPEATARSFRRERKDSQGEGLRCYLNTWAQVLISARPRSVLCCEECSLNSLAQKAGFAKSEGPLRGLKQGRKFKFQSPKQPFAKKPSFPSFLIFRSMFLKLSEGLSPTFLLDRGAGSPLGSPFIVLGRPSHVFLESQS